ncbi:protein KASH5-like [Penaeus indicus]|uniref:protein KASH5-like n=1 Tax=Penaeus indicus TaxID=29960 RepID=UPI00300D2C16
MNTNSQVRFILKVKEKVLRSKKKIRWVYHGNSPSFIRRSTLLPWLRPPGSSGPVPGDTLVMSRPPSPISPAPSFIFNQNANNNNNVDNTSFRGTGEKANHVPQLADHSGLNYTFGSLEDEAGTHRPDPGELQQEVLELEHTNRRLTGENAELTTHLTNAEDLNTSLREQCRQLEQALNSVQHQLAGARRMETEIEEFRNLLDMEREEKGRLLGRLGHLEKDNQELAARLEDLVAQVNAAHEEAEGRATREAQLVAEHKTQVATLMEKLSSWKSQAQSQGSIVRDLEETVKDLRRVIEVLKDEKSNLEQQLTCLREELTSVTTQPDHEIKPN